MAAGEKEKAQEDGSCAENSWAGAKGGGNEEHQNKWKSGAMVDEQEDLTPVPRLLAYAPGWQTRTVGPRRSGSRGLDARG